MGHLACKQTLPFTLNRANLFLDYNNQIMYSLQYQIKYLRGCHRSGNGLGKKLKILQGQGNVREFYCAVPENVHTPPPPTEGFLLNAPPLLPLPGNSSLFSYQGGPGGGPKTLVRAGTFCVSESSNKILRHIRSKTWPEARPAARQKE